MLSDGAVIRHGREICTVLGRGESPRDLSDMLHHAKVWIDGSLMPGAVAANTASIVAATKEHLCPAADPSKAGTSV